MSTVYYFVRQSDRPSNRNVPAIYTFIFIYTGPVVCDCPIHFDITLLTDIGLPFLKSRLMLTKNSHYNSKGNL